MHLDDGTLLIDLPDADAATRFALQFARKLTGKDTVLLSGPVGAGKSHFARAVIRHHLGAQTEVPSPTFTLVQVYSGPFESGPFEIWHADLYRLSHSGEVAELGLDQAMGQALCLIEWPDRLGPDTPDDAIAVALSYYGDGRKAAVTGAPPALRAALVAAFAP